MHQQYGVVYGKQRLNPIEPNIVTTRSERLAPPPACLVEQEANNAPDPNIAAANNRLMINQLRRVICEMEEVLQEQDERNRQMQEVATSS